MIALTTKAARRSMCSKGVGASYFSQQAIAKLEMDIVKHLRGLTDPVTNRPLQSLGMLQSVRVLDGIVRVGVDFLTPGYPYQNQIMEEFKARLARVSWVKEVQFQLEPPKRCANLNSMSLEDSSLSKVGHIVAVSSCKGGVGKSTVAVNLAITLSKMGLRVGILDADIYGPSLPELIPAESADVLRSPSNPKRVLPLRSLHHPDLRMLSFGHVNPKSGAPGAGGKTAAVVRGPIASRIINQLLLATEWGELDFLVVDMPPGTGDVQITLSQSSTMSGAVVVTTPHRLALVDAAKGVAMFEELKVPTLAVVENMAYFTCKHGTKYYPFGRGGRENLLEGCAALLASAGGAGTGDIPKRAPTSDGKGCGGGSSHVHAPDGSCGEQEKSQGADEVAEDVAQDPRASSSYARLQRCPLHSLPLLPVDPSAAPRDATLPVCTAAPDSEAVAAYRALAQDVLKEVFRSQVSLQLIPSISLSASGNEVLLRYFGRARTTEFSIPVVELRVRDPTTGKPRSSPGVSVDDERRAHKHAKVEKFDHKGQYGVAIVWSDGHFADIFAYDVLRGIADDVALAQKRDT